MHILGQKEAIWNTIFSIFERRQGPQTSRGPGKLPSPLSTGLSVSSSKALTGGDDVTDVVVVADVLGHEVLDELDVRIARSLHARTLPSLFL